MNVETLRQRRIPKWAAITMIALIVTLAAANMLRSTPQRIATDEASPASSPLRLVAAAPWLLSYGEARVLARRGATSAELAVENQQRWDRLQRRMLDDPWVIDLLRHRLGMTIVDLVGLYRKKEQ
jgi:hypothetical protein